MPAILSSLLKLDSSRGDRWRQAIGLLTQALPEKRTAARDLGRLLEAKTLTSYGASHSSEARASELLKYASRLVDEMEAALVS